MALLETTNTLRARQVSGICPVKVVLGGTVQAGDPLGYNSGWIWSVSATTYQPKLIAGQAGKSGDIITAYPMANVTVNHTVASTGTVGEKVAVADTGYYASAASNTPDIGFVSWVAADSLSSKIFCCPLMAQLAVERA
jgi:hypothetical protein